MVYQIALGTVLMLVTIAVSGFSLWWVETRLRLYHDWLTRGAHAWKLVLLLCGAAFWVLGIVTFGVWLWALTYYGLGLLPTLETSVYFALVSFTTLGYGDILLPQDWRLLGGMTAANGFITFGILIASLNDALRQIRLSQVERQGEGRRRGARSPDGQK